MASSQDLLDSVNAAILALTNGGASSYSINGRTVTKLELNDLYVMRKDLMFEVQRESGSGGFSLARFSRMSK